MAQTPKKTDPKAGAKKGHAQVPAAARAGGNQSPAEKPSPPAAPGTPEAQTAQAPVETPSATDKPSAATTQAPAAPEAAKPSKAAKRSAGKVLRVTARRPHFRRAGIAFGRGVTVVRESDLTEDQIKAIKNDPVLMVAEDTEEAED
ncbi:MAG: HI1506-related protein [Aquisalimonadaceae bacterium]